MTHLCHALEEVENFFDDVGVFTNETFDEHLQVLYQVLTILQDHGFTVKPSKCEWASEKTEHLGLIIYSDSLLPHAGESAIHSESSVTISMLQTLIFYQTD